MQFEIDSIRVMSLRGNSDQASNGHETKTPIEWSKKSSELEQPNTNHINWKGSENSKRYLIYHCKSNCGGFGDRLRGIVNAFVLSRITGRKFGIFHPTPCPLENFFAQNQYPWKVEENVLELKSSKIYSFMNSQKLPSNNMTSYFKEDVVYLKSNTDITGQLIRQADVQKRLPWISTLSTADLYRSVLLHLFVLNKKLQNELETFRSMFVGNNRTVCAHYRAGKNPTIYNRCS